MLPSVKKMLLQKLKGPDSQTRCEVRKGSEAKLFCDNCENRATFAFPSTIFLMKAENRIDPNQYFFFRSEVRLIPTRKCRVHCRILIPFLHSSNIPEVPNQLSKDNYQVAKSDAWAIFGSATLPPRCMRIKTGG